MKEKATMPRSLLTIIVLVFVFISGRHAQADDVTVAVYESELNAATYHGLFQTPLREWLKRNGYQFEVVGDKLVADSPRLARFAAVITSSCYIVPDSACRGLKEYVADGGDLIWIDAPARCQNKDLLATLGVDGAYTYARIRNARFMMLQPDHVACAGIKDFATNAVGNPAVKATGEVLATWSGEVGESRVNAKVKTSTFPAVVVTRTGKGRALLLNWILWAGREPEEKGLLGNAVEWSLADHLVKDHPWVVRLTGLPEEVTQPQTIRFAVRVFGHSQSAGRRVELRSRLLDAASKAQSNALPAETAMRSANDSELSFSAATMDLQTQRLPDGRYTVVADGVVEGATVSEARATVVLNAQTLARFERQQAKRAKMLRPIIGGTLGDYDAEPRTREGRVDIPRLLKQIEAAHMNMYDFLIWHANTGWEDFQIFASEAKKRGLKVWMTLVPPSEGPASAPFGLDYLKWAEEIGKLSKKYDNISAVVIDDFLSAENYSLFTPLYIAKVADTLRSINPRVAFLPTIYWGTIGDAEVIKNYGASMDGIVFPYADLDSTKDLPAQLEACRKWIGPNKFLLINVYASGSSGTAEKGPRSAEYMRSILTISHDLCDGIRIYCLPKEDFSDYRYAIAAKLYGKWNRKR